MAWPPAEWTQDEVVLQVVVRELGEHFPDGVLEPINRTIFLNGDQTPGEWRRRLMHELLHAMLSHDSSIDADTEAWVDVHALAWVEEIEVRGAQEAVERWR